MNAESLIARVPNLPSPAPAIARLLNLLTRPDIDNDNVVGILKQDPVLSAKVLAISNSAAFGLASPVKSLDEAMMYLGYAELHRIVMAISFGAALSPTLPGYIIEDGALWRHSLLTALISETVLGKVIVIKSDGPVAYTAGLIHDIGKLVISHALNAEKQKAVRELIDRGNQSLVEAEREVIGADHAEVGALLLRTWHLPEVLIEAVANHHHPPTDAQSMALSSVVHVADVIAHEVGASPGMDSFAVRAKEDVVEALGLCADDIECLIVSACDSAAEVAETISAI